MINVDQATIGLKIYYQILKNIGTKNEIEDLERPVCSVEVFTSLEVVSLWRFHQPGGVSLKIDHHLGMINRFHGLA